MKTPFVGDIRTTRFKRARFLSTSVAGSLVPTLPAQAHAPTQSALEGYVREQRTFREATRNVYYCRSGGPGVVVMPELPGITPEVADLGRFVAAAGYTVVIPSLFGTDGAPTTLPSVIGVGFHLCISREWNVFAANESSPIVDWLRDLCRDLQRESAHPYVGAIGLCITGGFALSLTVDTDGLVRAPVLSEPSLPFPMPFTGDVAALHLSSKEKAEIGEQSTPVIALHFTSDFLCQKPRFNSYRDLLGARLTPVEIRSPDLAKGIHRNAHSVLTGRFGNDVGIPSARKDVLDFLAANLKETH